MSKASAKVSFGMPPAIRRLNALSALDDAAAQALERAMEWPRAWPARRELIAEGEPIRETLLIVEGWAARARYLPDGRRQIATLLLPGDLVGYCDQSHPVSSSAVIALTPVVACAAPPRGTSAALDRAYSMSRALDEAHLLAQVTRLGRMSAHERIADLFLELLERLELAGLATNGTYSVPLTQELAADVLGLTSVHVNRMLQHARRTDQLSWTGREIRLRDPEALREQIGRQRVRVSAGV